MKECKICKKNMPLSNFHKRNSSKDGYVEKCKNCVKEYTTNYYKELEKIKCEICQESDFCADCYKTHCKKSEYK